MVVGVAMVVEVMVAVMLVMLLMVAKLLVAAMAIPDSGWLAGWGC